MENREQSPESHDDDTLTPEPQDVNDAEASAADDVAENETRPSDVVENDDAQADVDSSDMPEPETDVIESAPEATEPAVDTAEPATEAIDLESDPHDDGEASIDDGGTPSGGDAALTDDGELASTAAMAPVAADDDQQSPPSDDESAQSDETPAKQSRRGRKIAIISAAAVTLLAGAYGAYAYYVQDKIAPGVTVLGTDIGGMEHDQAVTTLEESLSGRLAEPIAVSALEQSSSLDPATSGLAMDYEGTVASITGFTLDPRIVFQHILGGSEVDPVFTIDSDALTSSVSALSEEFNVPPVDSTITFEEGNAVITDPVDGVELDVQASTDLLASDWAAAEQPIELVSDPVTPIVDASDIQTAMDTLVTPMLSGPVQLSIEGQTFEVSTVELATAATLTPDAEGVLSLSFEPTAIIDRFVTENPDLAPTGTDAHFEFQGGVPVVIPSTNGIGLNPDDVAGALLTTSTSVDNRTATLALTETEPDLTTAEAEALGVSEIIVEFSTPITSDSNRTNNLIVASDKLTGVLILPGEEFSLLSIIAPINAANGYREAGVLADGVSAMGMGGGLSQVSTNAYNVGYLAGADIVQFTPHSRWYSRYPEGRESTIWVPDLDVRWVNSTPYGWVLESWVANGRLYTRIWSTPYWEVESYTSPRRNFTSSQTIYSTAPDCIAESGGQQGFTVDVTRTRSLNGVVDEEYTTTTTYNAWPRVVCGPPPGAQP